MSPLDLKIQFHFLIVVVVVVVGAGGGAGGGVGARVVPSTNSYRNVKKNVQCCSAWPKPIWLVKFKSWTNG